jgi:hypothetical protein
MIQTRLLFIVILSTTCFAQWYLPAQYGGVTDIDSVKLSKIGAFGLVRKARPGIPEHFHTGIDIRRPGSNYLCEPVFPASSGRMASIVDNGPFSQIIIEHAFDNDTLWTVYEHVHVLKKEINLQVSPFDTIAWYFNRDELNRYGWQFDHFHFEIMKIRPPRCKAGADNPFRRYYTYALTCYTRKTLDERMEDPMVFLKGKISTR